MNPGTEEDHEGSPARIVKVLSAHLPSKMTETGHAVLAAMTEDIILRIHEAAGSPTAGKHRGGGVKNRAGFKRLVEDICNAGREERDFRDLIAMIFDDIDRDPQPFSECNHRTALLLGRFIAKQFGYNLKFSGPEGMKIRAVWENMTRAQFRKWIDGHLLPLKGD